jgi:hypothetical protein
MREREEGRSETIPEQSSEAFEQVPCLLQTLFFRCRALPIIGKHFPTPLIYQVKVSLVSTTPLFVFPTTRAIENFNFHGSSVVNGHKFGMSTSLLP